MIFCILCLPFFLDTNVYSFHDTNIYSVLSYQLLLYFHRICAHNVAVVHKSQIFLGPNRVNMSHVISAVCIAFSNAMLNKMGKSISPCLNPLLVLKLSGRELPFLPLPLDPSTHIFVKLTSLCDIASSVIAFHTSTLLMLSYTYWKSINKFCNPLWRSQHFSQDSFLQRR